MAGRGSENLSIPNMPRQQGPQKILVELAGHDKIVREHAALKLAAEKLLKAFDSLLPGIKFIAVQDYALLNEAPMNMRNLLNRLKEK
jgi:hypothetical protein